MASDDATGGSGGGTVFTVEERWVELQIEGPYFFQVKNFSLLWYLFDLSFLFHSLSLFPSVSHSPSFSLSL
jgi:hypothetical protein